MQGPGALTNIIANSVVIVGPGSFLVYATPAPALNNLIASVLPAAFGTVDSVGNHVLQGVASYGTSVAVTEVNGFLAFYTGSLSTGWTQIASITPSGSSLLFGVPTAGGLFSGPVSITSQAGVPVSPGSYATLFGNAFATLNVLLPSGISGAVPVTQSEMAVHTNANLVPITAISKQWSIPANDGQVGTKYEIVLPWQATMEATNTLQLGLGLNGAVMSNAVTIAAAIVGAGVGIRGTIRASLKVFTTGAAGTADLFFDGTVQQTGAAVTFANSGSIPTQPALSVAFNTTVANTLQVNSLWGGSTAGQTVSGYDSDFIRSGP